MTLYVMENSRLVVGQPMESSCIVFNMEGFTLSNMVSNKWDGGCQDKQWRKIDMDTRVVLLGL